MKAASAVLRKSPAETAFIVGLRLLDGPKYRIATITPAADKG
jgi:hypothetical protein